jgi:hypothetical protein
MLGFRGSFIGADYMAKLDALLEGARRDAVIQDVVAAVERHAEQRKGLRGVTLRAGLAWVRGKLPDAVPRTVTRLLPDLVAALEPLHAQSQARTGADFSRYLKKNPATVGETLMGIADARVERSSNAALKAFYARFRSTAEHEAEGLVPALADALAKHL